LLAEPWDQATDLSGWWMSEKLDGVRAYWDGKGFISRLGNTFHAPDWFLDGLPNVPLDGELWIGRKAFQRTVGIVRRQDKSDLWKEVRFLIFDAPAVDGPFEDRLAFVRDRVVQHRPPHAHVHEHGLCTSLEHLREELARVEALGGEGLMMRKPQSRYEVGRSLTLLKIKSFRDGEARVIEHQKGAGRHKGRLGALLVELEDGTRFSVGTGFSDAEREAPPAIGAIITFRYQELSDAGVPRFPSFLRVRDELS
jgi:DNA ligase-1